MLHYLVSFLWNIKIFIYCENIELYNKIWNNVDNACKYKYTFISKDGENVHKQDTKLVFNEIILGLALFLKWAYRQ